MKPRRNRNRGRIESCWIAADRPGSRTGEVLEDRLLLSNLAITDAFLVDGNNSRISTPILGEQTEIRTLFSTTDLPPNASYALRVTINGVPLDQTEISFGAGAGEGAWFVDMFHGFAEAGTRAVQIQLDSLNQISEDNENDNSFSFTFSPVSATNLPQKLGPFVSGSAGTDWRITNFADLDPRPGIVRDYRGGQFTYDTDAFNHDAIDLDPGTFSATDAGVAIYAAADGVVTAISDGAFDRITGFTTPAPPANYVIIDMGNGWQTKYWHLRRDSVSVSTGDRIKAGDFLGWMGSSGFTTGPHVHFELTYNNHPVETMLDPSTFWVTPPAYPSDYRHVLQSGFSSQTPTSSEWAEQPQDIRRFRQGNVVHFWVIAGAVMPGDRRTIRFLHPDGSVFFEQSSNPGSVFYKTSQWSYLLALPATGALGEWTAVWLQNDVELARETFTVANIGVPELRVEQNGGPILNNRFTPIDFGRASSGTTGPTRSFTIRNQGTAVLSLGTTTLPAGFEIATSPAATLSPGQSTTLTVRLQTSAPGYVAGELTMLTNDSDESTFRIWLEGLVENVGLQSLIPGISIRHTSEGTWFYANVRRTGSTSSAVTVTLAADSTELILPTTVTIPAGASFVNFRAGAVQDVETDGDQRVTLSASATGLLPGRNEVLVTDRRPFFTITPSDNATTVEEGGSAGTLALVLTEQPASPVTIRATLRNPEDLSLQDYQWTFDASNWNVAQEFTVSAVDDLVEEPDEQLPITFAIDSAISDPSFSEALPRTMFVTVRDNEPQPPQFTASGFASTTQPFTFSWTPVSGAQQYELRLRLITADGERLGVYRTTEPSFTISRAAGMGLYRAAVRAIMPSGFVTRSSPLLYVAAVGRVTLNPVVRFMTSSRPSFHWGTVQNAVRYEIRVDNLHNESDPIVLRTDVTTTSFQMPAHLPMGYYGVSVRAVDGLGISTPWTRRQGFYVMPKPVPIPVSVSTFDTTPTLRWRAVTGAVGYEILLRNASTGQTIVLSGQVTDPSFTTPEPLTSGRYEWRVRAIADHEIVGFWSDVREIRIGGQPILHGPFTENGRPVISWDSVIGAVSYQVIIHAADNRADRLYQNDRVIGTSVQLPAIPSTGTYRVWVRSISTTEALSPWSRPIDFTA